MYFTEFASLSDPVSTGGAVNLKFVTSYIIAKECEKRLPKGGVILEILNI